MNYTSKIVHFFFCKDTVLICFILDASCQKSGASAFLKKFLYYHTIHEESNAEQEVEGWQDYYGQESQYAQKFLFFPAPHISHIAPPCRVINILTALVWDHE